MSRPYPTSYSNVKVSLRNGEDIVITIVATHTIGQHLSDEMSKTGWLRLRSDNETVLVAASEILSVHILQLTTGELQ